MIAKRLSVIRIGWKYSRLEQVIGNINLKNPYPPNFSKIPASKTEPAIGASTCAFGSHKWKGIIGIFIDKLMPIPSSIQISVLFWMFKKYRYNMLVFPIFVYILNILNSIKKEPINV